MTPKVLWSPQARKDLVDIYLSISSNSQAVAERYLSKFQSKVARLSDHPRLGKRRVDVTTAMRQLVEPPFLILYRIFPDTDADEAVVEIVIVRVVDGRRRPKSLV